MRQARSRRCVYRRLRFGAPTDIPGKSNESSVDISKGAVPGPQRTLSSPITRDRKPPGGLTAGPCWLPGINGEQFERAYPRH